MWKLLKERVGSEVHEAEVEKLADDEEIDHAAWMFSLVGREEELELFE